MNRGPTLQKTPDISPPLIVLLIWFFMMPTDCSKAVEVGAFDDNIVTCWQTEDGLPQSSVLSIGQTPDGYLWLATFDGLARFDGVRFTVFDTHNLPGLPGNRLVRLSVDREGGLWMITEYRSVARLKDGRCRTFTTADGVPAEGVQCVGEDAQGGMWLAGLNGGLWRWQDDRFVPVPTPPEATDRPFLAVVTDGAGRPWFQYRDGLCALQDGRLRPIPGPQDQPKLVIRAVCPSADGGLWVITDDALRKCRQGQWLPKVWPLPDFKSAVVDASEDLAGNLWMTPYNQGLYRFSPAMGWKYFTVESGLPTLALRRFFRDREGHLWIGTDGGGLLRIRPRLWKMTTRHEGLGIDAVHSVAEDPQGRIWFAGGTATPYWLERGKISAAFDSGQSSGVEGVWAVLAARDGAMWIGTYYKSVFRYQDTVLTRYGPAEGMRAGSVRALFEDGAGAIWVGGFDGLSRIENGQVTHYSPREGLSCPRVWALAEGEPGRLYVGTDGGGLNVFEEGRFTVYSRPDGLPDNSIRALYMDAEGVLWIGTHAGGLSRFANGRFFNYQMQGGLPARKVGPMVEDDQGSLWMVTNLGILRVSRRELDEFAAGARRSVSFVTCDRSDGLATTEVGGVQPACLKARDGTLWFGTIKGAAFVDPAAVRSSPPPPPVLIEEVQIDGKPVRSDAARRSRSMGVPPVTENHGQDARATMPSRAHDERPITLLPHQRRLEFRVTGLSFTAPAKVQFRYQMGGFDPDWVDGGTARTVSYTRLPPGRYRFRVTARNSAGPWNQTVASRVVIVLAPWYRTWWAIGSAILSGAGLLAWFYQRRLHRLQRAQALQEGFSRQLIASQEAERRRLAGELHDGLGQDLLLIKNHAVLALDVRDGGPAVKDQIEEISIAASRAIDAARTMAHALGPYELEQLGLAGALGSMIDRIADATGLAFHCQFDHSTDALSADRQIALYRILQESLNNVVKHARAKEVFLEIQRSADHLEVRLQDDGCGFEIDAAGRARTTGGHGLPGIYERAHLAGGRARIQSAPGRGTVLTLEFPLGGQAEPHTEE